jgi:hypothetical protein
MTQMPPPMPPTNPYGGYAPVAYPPPVPGGPLDYASPTAVYGHVAWREGSRLVVRKGAMLPPRCVKCNEPAEGQPIRRNFTWHQPILYLLILAGVLVYAIVALIVQEKGTVYLSLCKRHRERRLIMGWSAGVLCLGGLFLLVYSAMLESGLVAIAGAVALVAGLVLAVMNQTLSAKRIDAHFLWLGGAGEGFLANFPPGR